jgi:ribose-phosphate pyrophosphokinase
LCGVRAEPELRQPGSVQGARRKTGGEVVIIDSDNYKASGVEVMFFPGGEPHAKIPAFKGHVVFVLKARTWNDVGIGACVWDALKRQYNYCRNLAVPHPKLFMPYFPAARQDRSDGTAPITKELIALLFGASRHLHVFDIHSDLGPQDWRPINWMPHHLGLPTWDNVDLVIAPDKGAMQRARAFQDAYCPNAKLVYALKDRDPASGRLSNYRLPDLPSAQSVLVVDDICDGGGTFNLLAEALWNRLPRSHTKLELFVSHGIFSKGLDFLKAGGFSHIYTTDSFFRGHRDAEGFVTTYPLNSIVEQIANV